MPDAGDGNARDVAVRLTAGDDGDTLVSRCAFGYGVVSSGRMIDTAWEAKNVAPFSASDADYVPSRAATVARGIGTMVASLAVREVTMEAQMSVDPGCIAQSRVRFLTRLDEVSRDEVLVRAVVVTLSWLNLYCVLQIIFSMRVIFMAALKLGEVRKLRPLFGSLSDAYTLRGFWG